MMAVLLMGLASCKTTQGKKSEPLILNGVALSELDTNGNEAINKPELLAHCHKEFSAINKDGNKYIESKEYLIHELVTRTSETNKLLIKHKDDPKELKKIRKKAMENSTDPLKLFNEMDTDKDSKLSYLEFFNGKPIVKFIQSSDMNRDGQSTFSEIKGKAHAQMLEQLQAISADKPNSVAALFADKLSQQPTKEINKEGQK